MKTKRQKIVAANWKMNLLPEEALPLIHAYNIEPGSQDPLCVVCPPFTHLAGISKQLPLALNLGAQNCSSESMGAYTGEVSARMLKHLDCSYVILGHSESRMRNPLETMMLPGKLSQAFEAGLRVIYCCGESQETRQNGFESAFIEEQITKDLGGLDGHVAMSLVIAYEPIWAIGTGLTASTEQIEHMHRQIRQILHVLFGQSAQFVPVLYGGSVNAGNAIELSDSEEVDGVLVGGSSLKPAEFKAIYEAFRNATSKD